MPLATLCSARHNDMERPAYLDNWTQRIPSRLSVFDLLKLIMYFLHDRVVEVRSARRWLAEWKIELRNVSISTR